MLFQYFDFWRLIVYAQFFRLTWQQKNLKTCNEEFWTIKSCLSLFSYHYELYLVNWPIMWRLRWYQWYDWPNVSCFNPIHILMQWHCENVFYCQLSKLYFIIFIQLLCISFNQHVLDTSAKHLIAHSYTCSHSLWVVKSKRRKEYWNLNQIRGRNMMPS